MQQHGCAGSGHPCAGLSVLFARVWPLFLGFDSAASMPASPARSSPGVGDMNSSFMSMRSMGSTAGGVDRGATVTENGVTKQVLVVVDPPELETYWDDESQAAVIRLQNAVSTLRDKLQLMISLKELDEGVEGLLLQVAMQMPLATPIAVSMQRTRGNGVLRCRRWSKKRAAPIESGEPQLRRANAATTGRVTAMRLDTEAAKAAAAELEGDAEPDEPAVYLVTYETFLHELALLPDRSDCPEKKQRYSRVEALWCLLRGR